MFQIYALLWVYNIVPLLFPGLLFFYIARARLFPPTSTEILRQATNRIQRSAEARELSCELHLKSGFGLVAQRARGLYHNLRGERTASPQGSALARGLEGSATLAGMMGAATPSRPRREIPRSSPLARAVATSSAAGAVAAPSRVSIDDIRPQKVPAPAHASETEMNDGLEKESKGKSVSLYGIGMKTLGPPIQEYLGQASDIAEKIKKYKSPLLSPDFLADSESCRLKACLSTRTTQRSIRSASDFWASALSSSYARPGFSTKE